MVGVFALGVAVVSASQDVSIDAYRVMLFRREEMDEKIPYASAIATAGWYSGYAFIGGTLALWLGGETMGLEWPQVYRALTGFVVAADGGSDVVPGTSRTGSKRKAIRQRWSRKGAGYLDAGNSAYPVYGIFSALWF